MDIKSERRWWVRQTIIAINIVILGVAFYADYNGISLDSFKWAVGGFQTASGVWFVADYYTRPRGEK